MSAHTLHIDLPDAERPSIWPWLIALLAGGCLMVLFAQKLQSIPASLQQQAQAVLDGGDLRNIQAVVDGRDLTLNGTISIKQSVTPLLETLASITGVRRVTDNLTVIDPVDVANQKKAQFQQALSKIDTATVAFQPGSISFTSNSNAALSQLVDLLETNADYRIRIEGHTDDTGPATVNLRVSRERAQAVSTFLQNNGVGPDQLIAKGYGSTQPIDDNTTEAGRARNRRIEISYVD